MMNVTNLRKQFMEVQKMRAAEVIDALRDADPTHPEHRFNLPSHGMWINEIEAENMVASYEAAYMAADKSVTIVFSVEQIVVFWDLIKSRNFVPSVEYKLPFEHIWLQFSSRLLLQGPDVNPGEYQNSYELSSLLFTQWQITEKLVSNCIHVVDGELDSSSILWEDDDPNHMSVELICSDSCPGGLADYDPDDEQDVMLSNFRLLAAACIQYINCENVYLEKQGEVPESVNRKREAKGKSRLEPYYVCRIKGVQHDSHATGEGAKHGIRYDVRGHFRRLDTGKTIWVRSHQRGLANELYVPKVYKVEKGSKPAFGKEAA